MKLKNTNKLAIELASNISGNRLELHGNSDITGILEGVHVTNTNIENTFLYIYGVDTQFFYSASIFCRDKCNFSEIGIGHIELDGAKPILYRDKYLYHQKDGDVSLTSYFSSLDCKHEDEKIIITSYSPRTIHEILYSDNCIIASTEAHVPSSVHLNKNSFLMRLDNNIESVSFDDLSNINDLSTTVKNLFCKYTKQIVLNTSRLDVKTVGVGSLIIKQTKSPLNKKGEIHYNEAENELKFFDGEKWRYFFK